MFSATVEMNRRLRDDEAQRWIELLVAAKRHESVNDWSPVKDLGKLNPEEMEGYAIEQVEEQSGFEMWEEFEELNDLED